MSAIRIQPAAEELRAGQPGNRRRCPWALAIARALNIEQDSPDVEVDLYGVALWDGSASRRRYVPFPRATIDWIVANDRAKGTPRNWLRRLRRPPAILLDIEAGTCEPALRSRAPRSSSTAQ